MKYSAGMQIKPGRMGVLNFRFNSEKAKLLRQRQSPSGRIRFRTERRVAHCLPPKSVTPDTRTFPQQEQTSSRGKAQNGKSKISTTNGLAYKAVPYKRLLNGDINVLEAVARLGVLEKRIGYRFHDKLLGLAAFRVVGDLVALSFEGVQTPTKDYKRLALLGDRVLDMALCRMWYESGQSRGGYAQMESSLVTRTALAKFGHKIQLEEVIMVLSRRISYGVMGEVFEALMGAVYVDSRYNLDKVQDVLTTIGFSTVTTSPVSVTVEKTLSTTTLESRRQHDPEADKNNQANSSADLTTSPPQSHIGIRSEASPVLAESEPKSTPCKFGPQTQGTNGTDRITREKPNLPNLTHAGQVLRKGQTISAAYDPSKPFFEWLFRGVVYHQAPQDELSRRLRDYCKICLRTTEHLSWFPKLQTRYMHSLEMSPNDRHRHLRDKSPKQAYQGLISTILNNSGDDLRSQRSVYNRHRQARKFIDCFLDLYRRTSGNRHYKTRRGTTIENLRYESGIGPRAAFLTALYVEDQMRAFVRRTAGFPDYYDLPQNHDKIPPPWRVAKQHQKESVEIKTLADWQDISDPGYSFLHYEDLNNEQPINNLEEADSPAKNDPEVEQPRILDHLVNKSEEVESRVEDGSEVGQPGVLDQLESESSASKKAQRRQRKLRSSRKTHQSPTVRLYLKNYLLRSTSNTSRDKPNQKFEYDAKESPCSQPWYTTVHLKEPTAGDLISHLNALKRERPD